MLRTANLAGALTAIAYIASCILIFAFRLAGHERWGYGIGYAQMLAVLPLIFLLVTAPSLSRPALYYVQVILMLAFILLETMLDYALRIEFRRIRWMVICYVVLFFAATGGMLGVAALGGRAFTVVAGILFLAMAVLTFVQRAVTGL
jgi:hypothetical protein